MSQWVRHSQSHSSDPDDTAVNFSTFSSHPTKKLATYWQSLPSPAPNLLSVSLDLPVQDISCKWNHTGNFFLSLFLFALGPQVMLVKVFFQTNRFCVRLKYLFHGWLKKSSIKLCLLGFFFGRGSKFLIINACRIILIFKVRIAIHLINIFMEETPYTSVNQCGKIPTTLI